MIRGGFLSAEDRRALTGLARDGLAEHRVARRANAIVLLDQGWTCERVAAALLLDDDTIRNWHRAFERGGVAELKSFGHEGGSSRLSSEQESALSDWVDTHCPRSIREVAAFLKRTFGQSYSRSGLIALLHRLGFNYRKPEAMPRGLDDARQQAFIDQYETLLNTMGADEAVVFIDAVHPTHQVRPARCWARKDVVVAVEQTTGRERLNIHGDAPHPCLCRQRQLSQGQRRQRVAREGRAQSRSALPSALLSPSRSHRTVVGLDARKRHPQPGPQDLRRVPPGDHQVPPAYRAQTMEAVSRPNHRQFPRHPSRRFSGSRLIGVYQKKIMIHICLPGPSRLKR